MARDVIRSRERVTVGPSVAACWERSSKLLSAVTGRVVISVLACFWYQGLVFQSEHEYTWGHSSMMTVFYQPGSPVGLLLIMQVEEHVVFFVLFLFLVVCNSPCKL